MTDVPDVVVDQLADIREIGACNMFGMSDVQRIAERLGYVELVRYIDENGVSGYSVALRTMGRRIENDDA